MIPTPAAPGAIDYDDLVKLLRTPHKGEKGHYRQTRSEAADAVEALREDLAGYDSLFNLQQKRERPWIEAWRKATGKHDTLPDYGKLLAWICDRAETAEARVVALTGALQKIGQSGPVDLDGNDDAYAGWSWCYDVANAVLAATPAEALERARGFEQLARDAVLDLGRYARDAGPERRMVSVRLYEKALDKLDTLGKEGP